MYLPAALQCQISTIAPETGAPSSSTMRARTSMSWPSARLAPCPARSAAVAFSLREGSGPLSSESPCARLRRPAQRGLRVALDHAPALGARVAPRDGVGHIVDTVNQIS